MKKILFVALAMLLTIAFCNAQEAKDYKEFIKERNAIAKLTKEARNEKASKDAKKEAKNLAKEGWKVALGSLPLDKQLDKLYQMQYEFDMETGFPKFVKGQATSIGGNYDAAKMQAVALAKTELAGNIATEVAAVIENKVANKQLDNGDATSVTESVMGGVQKIKEKIGQTIIGLEMFREKNGKKEVSITILYSGEMARAAAKKAIQEDMESRGDKLVEKANELLGF